MTHRIIISLWYNYGQTNPLAIPEAPELGENPHAQKVMQHYGISYTDCMASPVTDSWQFFGCDKVPDPLPRWMSVYEEAPEPPKET